MKKLLTIGIILIMMLQMVLPGFALDTVNQKALVLNQLTILKGDGNSLNLTGQLKRSEAAAFIVRLMGDESKVLANAKLIATTQFSDVKVTDWYAPYVNYLASLSVINGYDDGTYKPNDFVSEKAFLKLVLGTMGHIYGKDFNWNTVLTYAKNQNLFVTGQLEDNTNYSRDHVASSLYSALNQVIVGGNATILHRLVSSGQSDSTIAQSTGLLPIDQVTTTIKSVLANSATSVVVTFNEEIGTISKEAISIVADKGMTPVEIKNITFSANTLTITTALQIPQHLYGIKIDRIIDKSGFLTKSLTGEFKGFGSLEVLSDYFKIRKAQALNERTIQVDFTQPININAEIPTYYDIYKNGVLWIDGSFSTLTVKKTNVGNHTIHIVTQGSAVFFDSDNLEIRISGDLYSNYGLKLNQDKGDKFAFTGNGSAEEAPFVKAVTLINQKTIEIEFSGDVDLATAKTISNYTLKYNGQNLNLLSVAQIYGTNKFHVSVFQPMLEKNLYAIQIKSVLSGGKSKSMTTFDYEFFGSAVDGKAYEVVYSGATDLNTVVVYFSRPINPAQAEDITKYTLVGPGFAGMPLKVKYDPAFPEQVTLYLATALANNSQYTLTVSNTLSNNVMQLPAASLVHQLTTSTGSYNKPSFEKALFIGSDSVLVTFSKDIATSGINQSSSNYFLEYREDGKTKTIVSSGVSILSSKLAVMKFTNVSASTAYVLKFTNLQDYSGVFTATTSDPHATDLIFGVN